MRRGYGEVVAEFASLSGAGPEDVWGFFAHGMLLNIVTALDLPAIADENPWAAAFTRPPATQG